MASVPGTGSVNCHFQLIIEVWSEVVGRVSDHWGRSDRVVNLLSSGK